MNIWEIFVNYYDYFLRGTRTTILISLITVFFGFLLGCLIALLRLSKSRLLSGFAGIYITVLRGTPLLVQLYIVYYQLDFIPFPKTTVLDVALDRALPCAIALSMNSAAYVAEVIRAGIQAVDIGQTEAARSLGMTGGQTMLRIILPQAIKNILPALCNEFVSIIKETSLASTFFVGDLMTTYRTINGVTYLSIEPLIIVGIIYFVLTFTLSKAIAVLERRLKTSD